MRFFLGRHGAERLHVVQAIRQFHEDDADVLDHREHHLAERFRLRFGAAAELDLVELADAINQRRNFGCRTPR